MAVLKSQQPTDPNSPLGALPPTTGINPVTGLSYTPEGPPSAPVTNPTYKQFVQTHGGVSTGRLAQLWDARFNGGKRFGNFGGGGGNFGGDFGGGPYAITTAPSAPGAASPPAVSQPTSPLTTSSPAPPSTLSDPTSGQNPPTGADVINNLASAGVGQPAPPDYSNLASIPNIPMPKTMPNIDLNQLYGPAQRSLDARRAAASAAQDKALADNEAFSTYINGLTGSTAGALGGTLQALGDQANQARQGSLNNINQLVAQALQGAGPGAQNADLANLSGTGASDQANTLLQSGQSAMNATPSQDAQAYLQRAGIDQGNIDKAASRAMQLTAEQSGNQLLGQIGSDQYNLDVARAQSGLQNVQDIRQYVMGAYQANIARAMDLATLNQKDYGVSSDFAAKTAAAVASMTGAEWRDFKSSLTSAQAKYAQNVYTQYHQDARNTQNNATKVATTGINANSRVAAAAARSTATAKLGSALTSALDARDKAAGATPVSMQQGGNKSQSALNELGQVASAMKANGQSLTYAAAAPILAARWPDLWSDPSFQAKVKALFP